MEYHWTRKSMESAGVLVGWFLFHFLVVEKSRAVFSRDEKLLHSPHSNPKLPKSTMASASNNPGTAFAAAVDAEIAKFRELQEEVNQLQTTLQTVLSQETENEMVLQELNLLQEKESAVVYKMTGPVLIKQDLEEAQQTVKKRLDFIRSEQKKIESKLDDKQKKGQELSSKIQQMQSQLQRTTADAVNAIKQQHNQ
jgi:prefoldin beta subunit